MRWWPGIQRSVSTSSRSCRKSRKSTAICRGKASIGSSGYLGLPSSKIFGVATFYNQFRLSAPGKIRVSVCRGTACHVKGSLGLLDSVKTLLGIDVGETTKDGLFSLETVACVGCCSIAPVIMANGKFFGRLDKKKLETLIEKFRAAGRVEE